MRIMPSARGLGPASSSSRSKHQTDFQKTGVETQAWPGAGSPTGVPAVGTGDQVHISLGRNVEKAAGWSPKEAC